MTRSTTHAAAQRTSVGSSQGPRGLALRPNPTGLPGVLKAGVEGLSGLSMDHVRVHYGSAQPDRIGALAFTRGADIHVAPGQERHVAHEAWHVVQQAQGRVAATRQIDGARLNDDVRLEREADAMGARALEPVASRRGVLWTGALAATNDGIVQRTIQVGARVMDSDSAYYALQDYFKDRPIYKFYTIRQPSWPDVLKKFSSENSSFLTFDDLAINMWRSAGPPKDPPTPSTNSQTPAKQPGAQEQTEHVQHAQKVALVTGGAGFIGRHLCQRLLAEKYAVIALDNYSTSESTRDRALPEGVLFIEGHTKDIDSLIKVSPDIIYHLGEYSRVEKSWEEPEKVRDLNLDGTHAVLEFWQKQNEIDKQRCKLVYAGSSTKFGDNDLGRWQSPYAWSKANNTESVVRIGDEEGLNYAVPYFYNVYGPGERSDAFGTVIEIFIDSFLRGIPLKLVGGGKQRRNFTHVQDIVSGLFKLAEKGRGDGFGLGADKSYSVGDVAKLFEALGATLVNEANRLGNRQAAELKTEQSKRELDWQPVHELPMYIINEIRSRGEREEYKKVSKELPENWEQLVRDAKPLSQ